MPAAAGELIRVYATRPAIVEHGGGRVFISVHDATYLSARAAWRQKLAHAHPDDYYGRGTVTLFRATHKRYLAWKALERAWYAHYGLVPPSPSAGRPTVDVPVAGGAGRRQRTDTALLSFLADGAVHSAKACAGAAAISWRHLRRVVGRLQAQGIGIAVFRPWGQRTAYQLLPSVTKGQAI